jgi:hypothetical protein
VPIFADFAPQQPSIAVDFADAVRAALQAAAISGVQFFAISAVQVPDEADAVDAAEAVVFVLSEHAAAMTAHAPTEASTTAVKTSRECFTLHLRGV